MNPEKNHIVLLPPLFDVAIQAAEHGGLSTVRKALSALSEEVMVIIEESKKDDKLDADNNGKADASELAGGELVRRKVKLVLTKMNPEKVNDALSSIYKGTSARRAVHLGFFASKMHLMTLFFTVYDLTLQFGCPCWPFLPFNLPGPSLRH